MNIIAFFILKTFIFVQTQKTYIHNLIEVPEFFYSSGTAISYSNSFLVTPNINQKSGVFIAKERLDSNKTWEIQMTIEFIGNYSNHSEGISLWLSDNKLEEIKDLSNEQSFFGYNAKKNGIVVSVYSQNESNSALIKNEGDDVIQLVQVSSQYGMIDPLNAGQKKKISFINQNTTLKIKKLEETVFVYVQDKDSMSFNLLFSTKLIYSNLKNFFLAISGSTSKASSQLMMIHELIFVTDSINFLIKRSTSNQFQSIPDLFLAKSLKYDEDIYDLNYKNITQFDLEKILAASQDKSLKSLKEAISTISWMLKEEQYIKHVLVMLKYSLVVNVTDNSGFIEFKKKLATLLEILEGVCNHFNRLDEIIELVHIKEVTDAHMTILEGFSQKIEILEQKYWDQTKKKQ